MTADAATPPPVPPRAVAPRRRCARHEAREAVARCVDCGGGFCRECVTEHEDRLYCAPCFSLRVAPAARKAGGAPRRRLRGAAATACAMACLVAGFYLLGRALAAIPTKVHDGTVWKETLDR